MFPYLVLRYGGHLTWNLFTLVGVITLWVHFGKCRTCPVGGDACPSSHSPFLNHNNHLQ